MLKPYFPTEGNQLSGLWFLFFEEPESEKSAGCVGRKSWAKDFWRGGVRSPGDAANLTHQLLRNDTSLPDN